MPKGTPIKYTEKMEEFLKSHTHLYRGEMTKLFNEKFGTNISRRVLNAKCERIGALTGRTGRFSKGNPSWNAGLKLSGLYCFNGFKKGNIPHNLKPEGYERTTEDGYTEVKVNQVGFVLKQRLVWEQHHGPIPDNHVVCFKNGVKSDCRIDNLILLSRSELSRLNQSYIHLSTPETHETCLLMAKIKDKTHKLKVA